MEPIKPSGCCCAKPITDEEAVPKNIHWGKISSIAFLGLGLWFVIYQQLEPFSSYLTYTLFGIKKGSHLGAAMQFFVYDTPKVMMLLDLDRVYHWHNSFIFHPRTAPANTWQVNAKPPVM